MIPQVRPQRQTVLVVDDTPENVLLLVNLLKGVCRVKVAACGAKALELAELAADQPDLILLDVMMPDLDGYEVCRQLKRNPVTREIPVLFLTAKNEIANEARGFAAGGADYIVKPFSAALVLARVRTHLESRRLLRAERDLLETTLKGALAAILELIAMADPSTSEWNQRLAELAEAVARELKLEDPWMVGLAGALSRIGTLVVPVGVMTKLKAGGVLNTEERNIYSRVPEVGYRLLKDIPRLEGVAEMIYYSQKNFNGGGFPPGGPSGEEIPPGARILRVCLDFMNTLTSVREPSQRVSAMLYNLSSYDSAVTIALRRVIDEGFFTEITPEAGHTSRSLAFHDLVAGQILDGSVETTEGQLLIRQGTVLTAALLAKLANFEMIGAIQGPITVRAEA